MMYYVVNVQDKVQEPESEKQDKYSLVADKYYPDSYQSYWRGPVAQLVSSTGLSLKPWLLTEGFSVDALQVKSPGERGKAGVSMLFAPQAL